MFAYNSLLVKTLTETEIEMEQLRIGARLMYAKYENAK